MSLVIDKDTPRHFPKKLDVFEFDEEVAQIFENMAQRSIPMYAEMHRVHAKMLAEAILASTSMKVLDIGASTGRWFKVMRQVLNVDSLAEVGGLECHAIENSTPMQEKLKADLPELIVHDYDLLKFNFEIDFKFNIVTLFYVLQFIPNEYKRDVMQWIFNQMAPGATLLVGQKETNENFWLESLFQNEYIHFRLANGYTQDEITAKTAALKNSMWCISEAELKSMAFSVGFKRVTPSLRWLDFATYIIEK